MNKPLKPPGAFTNWLSLFGAIVAVGGVFAFLFLTAIDALAHHGNPYMGILAYVVSPGFIFLGIGLALLGAWLHRRHLRKAGAIDAAVPAISIDLRRPRDRRVLGTFVAGTLFFLMLTSLGSYQTYHYTESVNFCGQACHTPMEPEFVAFQHGPHARVECVECHIGEGATAFVEAKLRGVHQLFAMAKDDFKRPIPTPIKNLRPAQETCEQCHWPQQFGGQMDKIYTHYLADETNTPFAVRLSLKIGGGDRRVRQLGGIHWHTDPANKVEYFATDEKRQEIGWVRYTDAEGKVMEYRSPEFKGEVPKGEIRTMDCMDCHNRPAHQFQGPNDAIDLAMYTGRIDTGIPWVKSNTVAALIAPYATRAEAKQKITDYLRAKYPNDPKIEPVIAATLDIYNKNFFPEMKADWRAYPSNVGHKEWAGCFRCHSGNHKSPEGTAISANDCNSCHTILAQGSGDQLKDLSADGHSFFHIDAINEDFICHNCHSGAFPREL
jgi:hypothetical protein